MIKLEQAAQDLLDYFDIDDCGILFDNHMEALREALKEQAEQEPVAIGTEWKPCMKLPVVVHVREQREGESHVSTREGITPVKPDDLIMRGVAGEEYPIGRELFNKTYTFDTAAPMQQAEQEPVVKMHKYNEFQTLGSLNLPIGTKLYTRPVRTVDLTDEEEYELAKSSVGKSRRWLVAAAINAYKEKNNSNEDDTE